MRRSNPVKLALAGSLIVVSGCGSPSPPVEMEDPPPLDPSQKPLALERGEGIYRKACAACHGLKGDGRGPRARNLDPPPKDFIRGVYKCRSTVTGVLPLERDLYQTISLGMPGTSMPPFESLLSPEARRDVVEFIKKFSPRFEEETVEPEDIVRIPEESPATPESVARGKEVYRVNKCADCHGDLGRGDGPSARTLKDSWGNRSEAFDFTTGTYRCGCNDADIFRTFYTGMDGTPMPSYAGPVLPQDRWPLVHFVMSLHRKPRMIEKLILEVPE